MDAYLLALDGGIGGIAYLHPVGGVARLEIHSGCQIQALPKAVVDLSLEMVECRY